MKQTIFALASAQGRAGVSIVRISGPGARAAGERLCGSFPVNGRALRKVRSTKGDVLDRALVLHFAEDQSFTGDETVELHLHGSIAIADAVLRSLAEIEGLRHAEAGEFTQRAFENGRLDLTQVEGLADLIDAETEAQRVQAMRVFAGDLGALVDRWRRDLLRAAALIEATIDFADEEVPTDVTPEVGQLLAGVLTDLKREAAGAAVAERIRSGFEVAIVGPTNSGKSSLINALAKREAAITSDIEGTTRDVIEVHLDIGGFAVTFLDTAGLRDTTDEIEGLGIARGKKRAEAADLRIHMSETGTFDVPAGVSDILVRSKVDISGTHDGISTKTGAGLEWLISEITDRLKRKAATVSTASRYRHREAMHRAIDAIEEALQKLDRSIEDADVLAEHCRSAIRSLSALVGHIDVEDLLGEIFSSFCIGK